MLQYKILCHAQHIPAYPIDRHKDWPVSVRGATVEGAISTQTSALSGSVRSTSDFASTVPARNTCLAPVAAHHDMTAACLCVSLFIGSICVRFNLSCSVETPGGAPSRASAAAIMLPSKSSKPVPVNPSPEKRNTVPVNLRDGNR